MRKLNLILVFLGILVVFALGVFLHELREVLLPFVIAMLLSILFKPLVLALKARRIPTAVALVVVLFTFGLVLSLLGLILFSSADPFIEALPRYELRLRGLLRELDLVLRAFADRFNIPAEEVAMVSTLQLSAIRPLITSFLGSFLSFVSNTFLILLFMLFILAGSGELADKVKHAFPSAYAARIAAVVDNTDAQVRQYLLTKTLISAGTGALTALICALLGIDFALIWGMLAFLLNYIPNVGSLLAVVFPLVMVLLEFGFGIRFVLTLGLLGGTQGMMGNVVEPRMMAFSLNLSPLLILVALIFWGWLWGLWGMILAVPLTATIKIVFENIEPLKPLSVLMSGPVK